MVPELLQPDDIAELYRHRSEQAYEGEGVTQLQHAWQCGRLAWQARSTPALELAAWLHDLGHLLTGLEGTPTLRGIDDAHEITAARVLDRLWGPAVALPVALHVQAKRCLVATRPDYRARLSPDSIRSLQLQGGPMSAEEAAAFSALPGAPEALRLRAWDDLGKDAAWRYESVDEAVEELRQLMRSVERVV
jgi:predicted HD phosphohydrolase